VLTVPHFGGPWIGRVVDRARDVRRPPAIGCAVYATALALAVGLLDRGWPWPAGAALLVAGLCGPLLTGGLSSVAANGGVEPGRARGVDVITYGVAGSAGPAVVAGLAAATTPTWGLVAVAALALLAAPLVRCLPEPTPAPRRPPTQQAGVSAGALLLTSRPLRRVTVTTLAAAATGGALGVAAVLLAVDLTGRGGDGAWLVGALGIGNLAGAAAALDRAASTPASSVTAKTGR
jgi:hypothetical protein